MYEPCAYFENSECVSALGSHSWAVRGVALLVADRLIGAPSGLESRGDLLLALEAAAVYHDLGKASALYQERRGGFALHEHVSAVALAMAADIAVRAGQDRCARILRVAAAAAVRHHSAMRGRHPRDLLGSLQGLLRVAEAARLLPPGAGSSLAAGEVAVLVDEAIDSLRSLGGRAIDTIRSLLGVALHPGAVRERSLLPDTIMASGALIVADILAASVERRGELYKAYAQSWASELGLSLEALRSVVGRAAQPPRLDC